MERYVKELGKQNIILINKADFLSNEQRKHWAEFFKTANLPHAFYSAATANEKLTSHPEEKSDDSEESSSSSTEEEDDEKQNEPENPVDEEAEQAEQIQCDTDFHVLNREQLIAFLKSFRPEGSTELFSVGLVGYPNVGKSSTINSLMGIKRTSVSATPGKTKHFQVCVSFTQSY